MEALTLEVTQNKYATAKDARAAGRVPMAYYGKGVKNISFSADYQDFRRTYLKGGKSTILTLINEDKKEFPVLVNDVQYDPVTDGYLHADMMAVDMNKMIHTEIPLSFVGISPAVKDEGGVLVTSKGMVSIKCLPKDLVHEIEVDVSVLAEFGDSITVGDIKMPAGIEVLDAKNINVVGVSAPREEEVEVKPVAAVPVEGAPAAEAGKEGAPAAEAGKEGAPAAKGKEAKGGKKE